MTGVINYADVISEVDVSGTHHLSGNTRDILLSALNLLRGRDFWHYDDAELTDVQWDALDSDISKAVEEVLTQVNTTPVGAMEWYAGLDPLPDGWLLCDGTVYQIADYPLLGERLGSTYGGNGTTTFAVPLVSERNIRATLLESELGDTGGSDDVTLTVNELPAHTHNYNYPSVGLDLESAGVPDITALGNPPMSLSTTSAGNGQPFSVTNPYIKFRMIIRARADTMAEIETPVLPDGVPIGATFFWWGGLPDKYLDCSGQTVSKTTYPDLWAVLGYMFGGSGDNFVLPDAGERVMVGRKGGSSWAATPGNTGGEKDHLLTVAEMPSHVHTVTMSQGSGGSPSRLSAAGTSPQNINTSSVGSDGAHNNLQPYIVARTIIKALP